MAAAGDTAPAAHGPVRIRQAGASDAAIMAEILNEIIAAGGTTAHQRLFTAERMLHHYIAPPGLIAITLAERADGPVGFQSLVWPDRDDGDFAPGWAIIATFVRIGTTQGGIGSALFAQTRERARAAGVRTIDATIRADNTGGLAFYSRIGFRDYDRLGDVPLRDGRTVDRIRKRFDLEAPAR